MLTHNNMYFKRNNKIGNCFDGEVQCRKLIGPPAFVIVIFVFDLSTNFM